MWIDSKVAVVDGLHFNRLFSSAVCQNRDLLTLADLYSVVDERNMDTVLIVFTFDHLKSLKCVNFIVTRLALSCFYYCCVILNKLCLGCMLHFSVSVLETIVCSTSFLGIICRHCDCIIPTPKAECIHFHCYEFFISN